MAHGHCGPDEAFERLTSASRNRNIKLREVARMLVEHARTDPASTG
jgi:AmiR/NasT family two-component response regulator